MAEAGSEAEGHNTWKMLAESSLGIEADWDRIEQVLPIKQDPETRLRRKELWKRLDTNGKKNLNSDEAYAGIAMVLNYDHPDPTKISMIPAVKNLRPAVTYAFSKSSRLDQKGAGAKTKKRQSVSAREFHAFLICLVHALQVAEFFKEVDQISEEDETLSHRECLKHLEIFDKWGIEKDQIDTAFAGAKTVASPYMSYKDFLAWIVDLKIEEWPEAQLDDSDREDVVVAAGRYNIKKSKSFAGISGKEAKEDEANKEHRASVMVEFGNFDGNKDGKITVDEMAQVLIALDKSFTFKKVQIMFDAADFNCDGTIDVEEFIVWLFP